MCVHLELVDIELCLIMNFYSYFSAPKLEIKIINSEKWFTKNKKDHQFLKIFLNLKKNHQTEKKFMRFEKEISSSV